MHSGTPLYEHPDIMDSFVYPDELRAHIFSLKLTRLIRIPDNTDTSGCPPGGPPYNGPYGEAPPERGTIFRLEVYKKVGISRAEVWKRAGKTDI